MALIEFRKPAVGAEIGWILRSIIAVKVSRRVEAFAKSVVAEQGEVIAEALLDFQNSGLVNGRTSGSVLIVLDDQRIHKASEGIGRARKTFRATERISPRTKVPVSVRNALAVGQLRGTRGSRE